MINRDELILCTLMGATGGGVGIAVAILIRLGMPIEPTMSLVGAFIGAAGTVAGSVWLSDRNRNAELRQEIKILIDDLEALSSYASHAIICAPKENENWSDEYRKSLNEFGWKTRGSRMVIEKALERSRSLDFKQLASLTHLQINLAYAETFFQDCFETEAELEPWDERTWPGVLRNVIQESGATLEILRRGTALTRK
ncbi:hypothetical protein [Novosphingobium olei]|uniref:Uncharacterized protein n=1 Tax=Novosphingobium olei TaxID=2728851 RepID=A0A7Y0GAV2_9SPHN|nr:hypothetical protein [Novosphingobium olei]NML95465.1 hypothetical protein [Novosphingobium olei]